MNEEYLFYYIESMIVCSIVFGILLVHDLISGERDERKINFDHVLEAHIMYFIVDSFWASVLAGAIPKTASTVLILNYVLLVLLSLIASTWLSFALSVMELPWREMKRGRMTKWMPMALTACVTLVVMAIAPSMLYDEQYNTTALYQVFFLGAPVYYIICGLVYSMREAFKKENALNRKLYFILGIYPVTVLIAGIVQILFLNAPFFCYNSMIMILMFNLLSMENQISIDPLTRVNNRRQLMRYAMQDSNIHKDDQRTFIVMVDVNDFKKINDTYGHVEGDRALVTIADALKKTASDMDTPPFIARFGGDEFVILIHLDKNSDVEKTMGELAGAINRRLEERCLKDELPYILSVTIGYDEADQEDTFKTSLESADKNLYEAKRLAGVGR